MNSGKTVFSQIMDYLPMYEFRKCVNRYNDNYHTSSITGMDQFLCMTFAQLALCSYKLSIGIEYPGTPG